MCVYITYNTYQTQKRRNSCFFCSNLLIFLILSLSLRLAVYFGSVAGWLVVSPVIVVVVVVVGFSSFVCVCVLILELVAVSFTNAIRISSPLTLMQMLPLAKLPYRYRNQQAFFRNKNITNFLNKLLVFRLFHAIYIVRLGLPFSFAILIIKIAHILIFNIAVNFFHLFLCVGQRMV